jgi:hypothetical protein
MKNLEFFAGVVMVCLLFSSAFFVLTYAIHWRLAAPAEATAAAPRPPFQMASLWP